MTTAVCQLLMGAAVSKGPNMFSFAVVVVPSSVELRFRAEALSNKVDIPISQVQKVHGVE